MPVLGNRGRVSPAELQRAVQRPAPPAQRLAPAPGLGQVLHQAIRGVARTTAPAVHVASQVAASRADAASPTPGAARALDLRNRLEAAHVAAMTNAQKVALARQSAAQVQGVQQRFAAEGRRELQELAKQRASGASPLNLGFVNLTPLATTLATGATKLGIGQALGGVPGKLINEAIDLPGQTFLSSAIAGDAARRALGAAVPVLDTNHEGTYAPAEALLKGIGSQVEHPVRSFEQAPLATALTLAGGENVLGRLGGAAARTGLLGDKLAGLAATERAPLELYNQPAAEASGVVQTGGPRAPVRAPTPAAREVIAKEQEYNADPARKALQVGFEKALTKLPEGLGRQEDPFVAQGWRLKRNLIGGVVKPGRVDYGAASSEAARRTIVKNSVVPKAEGLKTATASEAVPLFFDRTIRSPATFEEDLAKRAQMLRDAQPSLRKSQLVKNEESLKQIEALKGLDPAEAAEAANVAIKMQHPLTAYEVAAGSLRPEQVRARLQPYASSHMGARHFTVEDHLALEQKAAAVEHEAQGRLATLEPGSAEHAHVADEVAMARAHRWEVAGRGAPEDQAAHEQSVADHQAAVQGVREAQARLSQVEHARSRLVGAHGRPRPQQDARASTGGGTAMDAADARLRGARERLAAARSREVELREAVHAQPRTQAGLRTAEGKHLPDEAIEAHMLAHGVPAGENGRPLVGFTSHQDGIAGSSSFFRSLLRQPSLHRNLRTGAAYTKGVADHSFAGLVGQLAHQASRVGQHEGFNALVHDYVIGHYDKPNAELAAENFNHPESTAVGADRVKELGGMVPIDKGTGQILAKDMAPVPRDVRGELERLGLEQHTPAQVADGVGKYGVIPKAVHDRLVQHQEAASAKTGFKKWAQLYTQGFRHVKFATSPKHALGIVEESAIRPVAEGAGVQSWRLGRQVLKQVAHLAQTDEHGTVFDLGPEGARFRRLQGELSGRGLVGSQKTQDIVRRTGGWDETSALGMKAELAAHSPPMKAWLVWRHFTERGLEGIAHNSRTAVFGKVLKDSGFVESAHSFLKLQDQAQRDLIAGKMTPNKADLVARRLDDAAGNWNNLTPKVKAAVSTVTPFGLWWLNSMRWLYRLPVTHPVKTAVAASIYQATREQRNAIGQGYDAPGAGTKAHPNYLQGTVPANVPILGHVLVDLGHYSPLGVAGPDAPATAAEQVGPQFEGLISAMTGTNALTHEKQLQAGGQELSGPQKAANALSEVVSGPTIGATQAQQLLQGGGKPYGTANLFTDILSRLGGPPQTKPGPGVPVSQSLLKLLDPLKTYKDPGAGASAAPVTPWARGLSQGSSYGGSTESAWKKALER